MCIFHCVCVHGVCLCARVSVCTCDVCACQDAHEEVSEQLVRVGVLFPPYCMAGNQNSSLQAQSCPLLSHLTGAHPIFFK